MVDTKVVSWVYRFTSFHNYTATFIQTELQPCIITGEGYKEIRVVFSFYSCYLHTVSSHPERSIVKCWYFLFFPIYSDGIQTFLT